MRWDTRRLAALLCASMLAAGLAAGYTQPVHAGVVNAELGVLDPTATGSNPYAGCVAASMAANGFVFSSMPVLTASLTQLWPDLPNALAAACRSAVDTHQPQVCLVPLDPSVCPGIGSAAATGWIQQVAALDGWDLYADGLGANGGFARTSIYNNRPTGTGEASITGTFTAPHYSCQSGLSCPQPSPGLYTDCGPFSCGPVQSFGLTFYGRTPDTPGYPNGENAWLGHVRAVDGYGHLIADTYVVFGNGFWGNGCGGPEPHECAGGGVRWTCLTPDGTAVANCADQSITFTITATDAFIPGYGTPPDGASLADFVRVDFSTDNLPWYPNQAQCGVPSFFHSVANDCMTWSDPRLGFVGPGGGPTQYRDTRTGIAQAVIDLASSALGCLIGVDAFTATSSTCTDVNGQPGALSQQPEPPTPPPGPFVSVVAPDRGPISGGTLVTVGGGRFLDATSVSFGSRTYTRCATSSLFDNCFLVLNDGEIHLFSPQGDALGLVDVTVTSPEGTSSINEFDTFGFEGWDPLYTPSDRSTIDVPTGTRQTFTLVGWERAPFRIDHSALPASVTCADTNNPGQPARIDCTVSPTEIGFARVNFFDAYDPGRLTPRTYKIGRGSYTALGDSFASGEGAPNPDTSQPPFIPPTDNVGGNTCHQSVRAYGSLVGDKYYDGQQVFQPCSGAVIDNFYNSQNQGAGIQPQLDFLSADNDLVTFSVGGNDIQFASIATDCIDPTKLERFVGGCALWEDAGFKQRLDNIMGRNPNYTGDTLDQLYQDIRKRSPEARVLVVGYPRLLPLLYPCPYVSSSDQPWLNGIARELDDNLQTAALRNGFEFVDVYNAFNFHELCTTDQYVNNIDLSQQNNPATRSYWLHPNVKGQYAFFQAVDALLKSGSPSQRYLVRPGQNTTTAVSVPAGSGQASFSTTWPGSDIVMTLTSPSGRTITRGTVAHDLYAVHGPTWETFSVTNPEPGNWTVGLFGASVAPDGESVDLLAQQQSAYNLPSTAHLSLGASEGTAPFTTTFDAGASTDADGTVASYAWNFGDGTTSNDRSGSHTFIRPGTYAVRLTVTDDQGGQGFDAQSVLVREPTVLKLASPGTVDYSDTVNLSASLTSGLSGAPIAGQAISLDLGTLACSATTDASGMASCPVTVTLNPGGYTSGARFDQTDAYAASTAGGSTLVLADATALVATAPAAARQGAPISVSVLLANDEGQPLNGRTVSISDSVSSCAAVTGPTGSASCSIAAAPALGPTPISAIFGGDAGYAGTTAGVSTVLYDYPAAGSFVVGDLSASGSVTFWGAQWAKANALSRGPADPDFKGFASATAPTACGVPWAGGPGSSGQPPRMVPAYMAVIATDSAGGQPLTGDVVHLVVVKVDPGYGPGAGQVGTGTVVATVC